MKKIAFVALLLSLCLLFSSCGDLLSEHATYEIETSSAPDTVATTITTTLPSLDIYSSVVPETEQSVASSVPETTETHEITEITSTNVATIPILSDTNATTSTTTEPPLTSALPPATSAKSVETSAPVVTTAPAPVVVAPEKSTFSIHFIDVGQADAALVECDGHYMLIDGGNKGDSSKMYSVLRSASVPKLDIVVATHAHEDHVGGLPGALNYCSADLTLCPVTAHDTEAFNDFVKYANKNGGGITVPSVGDTYSLGSASVKILGVNASSDELNDTSIILMVTYGNTKFLFTGDAERAAEQAVLDSGADLSCDVLKVGHHGSKDSTTYPFLHAIMPKYAVISAGNDNSFGHPTDSALSRLRDANVKVFRTDMQGDIYASSDGKGVTLSVTRNADADTLAIPDETPVVVVPPAIVTQTTTMQDEPQAAPAGTDYVMNKNTKKFHYPSCKSVKQMKEKNKGYYTGTRDELISMGYDPCGNCHP